MPRLEFLVDRTLNDGRVVVANNSVAGVPLGTIFTSLTSRKVRRDGDSFMEDNLAPSVAVNLELVEVESWRRSMNEVPKGHNAAVRLHGYGLGLLNELLQQRGESVYVLLSTGPTEA